MKMKLAKIFLLSIVLALAANAQQHSVLSGRILVDGKPIEPVLVVLKQDGREISRTASDSSGFYRFDEVPRGTVSVTVVPPGTVPFPIPAPVAKTTVIGTEATVLDFTIENKMTSSH